VKSSASYIFDFIYLGWPKNFIGCTIRSPDGSKCRVHYMVFTTDDGLDDFLLCSSFIVFSK
jgi:hypothetical protein